MVAADCIDSSSRPVAAWDQVVDQLSVMLRQEMEYNASFRNQDELFHQLSSTRPTDCISWDEAIMIRRKMSEWAYHVVDYFEYNRDVVGLALNIVDRYTVELLKEDERPMNRKGYQAIFVVSLYVSLKLQGSSRADEMPSSSSNKKRPQVINVEFFAELSRGMLTVKSLEAEERNLVAKLKFRLNPPTSGNFNEYLVLFLVQENSLRVNPFLPFGSIPEDALHHIFEVAKYHTELSTFDVRLTSQCRPSCVAAASILNTLDYLRIRMGDATIPPDVTVAFESNVMHIVPNVTAEEIAKVREYLQELCPSESLDAWPGGWNDSTTNDTSMEEPPKDQIMEEAGAVAPGSPTGVDAEIILNR